MLEELDEDIRERTSRGRRRTTSSAACRQKKRHAAVRKFGNVTRVKEDRDSSRVSVSHNRRAAAARANVRKAQKLKRFRFPFSSYFPVALGILPEVNPARLFWVECQSELPQPFPEQLQKVVCSRSVLKPQ
jgi:hypothetical protein